ncbi:MAG TPA: hypothetical protein VGQ52_19180 [Gemmatimonadaceae bacterium]|nr:hypothetical protein [Gemmatimonadaceae bacterium]
MHHALQVIVSVGISYLPRRPDDSHTNLEWLPDFAALGTNWLESGQRVRFGLRPAQLSLIALNDKGVTSELALDGRTVNDAVAWLRAALVAAGYDGSRLTTKKHYEIPAHPVASGAAFKREVPEKFAELFRSYADAHVLTSYIVETRAGASPPRCWPHHFDLATLITLPELAGHGTRTVGVGLSPGDDSYAEPYFYVGPNPHPNPDRLRALGSLGKWHTQGFVAAVLPVSELAQFNTAEIQRDAVSSFADAAVDASIAALA